jgi:hypothetical protein
MAAIPEALQHLQTAGLPRCCTRVRDTVDRHPGSPLAPRSEELPEGRRLIGLVAEVDQAAPFEHPSIVGGPDLLFRLGPIRSEATATCTSGYLVRAIRRLPREIGRSLPRVAVSLVGTRCTLMNGHSNESRIVHAQVHGPHPGGRDLDRRSKFDSRFGHDGDATAGIQPEGQSDERRQPSHGARRQLPGRRVIDGHHVARRAGRPAGGSACTLDGAAAVVGQATGGPCASSIVPRASMGRESGDDYRFAVGPVTVGRQTNPSQHILPHRAGQPHAALAVTRSGAGVRERTARCESWTRRRPAPGTPRRPRAAPRTARRGSRTPLSTG